MHALLSILVSGIVICVAAIGAVRFSCVASAAHFLIFKEENKMRKLTKTVSTLLTIVMLMSVVLCAPLTVSAAEIFTSGDYKYRWLNDGTVGITEYIGTDKDIVITLIIITASNTDVIFLSFCFINLCPLK